MHCIKNNVGSRSVICVACIVKSNSSISLNHPIQAPTSKINSTNFEHKHNTISTKGVYLNAHTYINPTLQITHLGPFRLLMQLQYLLLKRLHPPKRRPDEHTTLFRIGKRLGSIAQLGILQCQPCRRHGKVRKSIIALGILGVREMIVGVEHFIGYLRADLTGVICWIEAGNSA